MRISHYYINYSRDDDRVCIFVRDGEGDEIAFGLTRRLVKQLWPALGKTIQAMSEAARKTPASLQKEVLSIEQQGAVSEAKQSGTLSGSPLPPVEKRHKYLTRVVKIRDAKAGGKVLTISDGDKVINIQMSYKRLIVFCDALKTTVDNSDWDLNLTYPWELTDPEEHVAPTSASSSDDAPTRH